MKVNAKTVSIAAVVVGFGVWAAANATDTPGTVTPVQEALQRAKLPAFVLGSLGAAGVAWSVVR